MDRPGNRWNDIRDIVSSSTMAWSGIPGRPANLHSSNINENSKTRKSQRNN